jgi:two-component system sensor histidine kinase KdpD
VKIVPTLRSQSMLERTFPLWLGVLAGVATIAVTTALAAGELSLAVVALLAVLAIAWLWGTALAIATTIGCALALNFFHIPPTGELTIADERNWIALLVVLAATSAAGALADAARGRAREADQRRREADLAAETARTLLRGDDLHAALPVAAGHLARALDLPAAAIVLGPAEGDDAHLALELREGEVQVGTLLLPRSLPEPALARVRERIVPSLEALLAAALERDALLADVVETRALRRSDVLKTALLRAVSHDLRTPLTAIIAAAEPLAGDAVDEEDRRELAAGISVEAARLSRLIEQLLDLSRLEAQAVAARPDWCAVDEVLRAAAEHAGDGAAFKLAVDPDLPLIRADAAQLERAFANLLENSGRHAAGHPVSVRARAVGRRIIVRIVDRGPGIPPADLERVFEPFHRGDRDGAGHRGSGLGLAIARGFLEVNGARVWAESLPGQGTSFVVELPLEPVPAPPPAAVAP